MLGQVALDRMNECESYRQLFEKVVTNCRMGRLVLDFLKVDVFALSGFKYLAFVRTTGATVGA